MKESIFSIVITVGEDRLRLGKAHASKALRSACAVMVFSVILPASAGQRSGGYPITPVPFTSVKVVSNSFWGQRLQASREVTIPLAFSKCESEGRYKNFEKAARALKDPADTSTVTGLSFDDTDVYKTIEGASYSLQTYPDAKMVKYMDSVLTIVKSAQEKDGYLYTARTMNPRHPHEWSGLKRWEKEEDLSHELYDLGHMVEAAIAHYQATGSHKFLDIARAYADCVCREVGPGAGQACVVPGHQIAEMALAKLYVVTGEKKYLDEAKFMLDYRGKTAVRHDYSQSLEPVTQQSEAIGHAVRAAYMYAGMADVAALTGDSDYIRAVDRIWSNIVDKKLYITGGIGATSNGEAFGPNYYLPNMSAYCETCAAIGNVYVNYRLFLLHGESKYYDVLERTLYNGLISGVSLDGGGFFYPNPLESMGQHQRQPWFGCACCPSNICRFIPSLPGYVYAVKDRDVYVNLFLANSANLKVAGKVLTLTEQTGYPWDGDITISIDKNKAGRFALKVRVPGWVRNQVVPSDLYSFSDGKRTGYTILVNGKEAEGDLTSDGYFTISRQWKKGDRVSVHFDMEPRTVKAIGKVEADRGQISVERGPLVYCAEWVDNDFNIMNVLVPQTPSFTVLSDKSMTVESASGEHTYPITEISAPAQTLAYDASGMLAAKEVTLTLIPYYAWCHRGSGNMKVWLPQDVSAARPASQPTMAASSKVDASVITPSLGSINDGLVPADENDRSIPYYHWWPTKGGQQWITYTFPSEQEIKSSTVYWYDDTPWGGCSVPASWKVEYRDASGDWLAVSGADTYPRKKGAACTVNFDPVKTTAVKLLVNQPSDYSCGLFEWQVR